MKSDMAFAIESGFEDAVMTVSQLNETVRDLLEDTFAVVWVEGEISNLVCPASGHMYFTLKDSTAQIRCAFFRSSQIGLRFKMENGFQVRVRARVSLYPDRGDYQLIIDTCELAGDGVLQRAFEYLKQKLAQEGLFDPHHKKAIPAMPQCIGIITSPTGAAVRDILSVLARRFAAIPVIIYPSQVQGEGAAAQLCAAIETANSRAECDVVLLARGGGSKEDLAAFNDEALARAIFASDIPIITGIGHEIDFTIADFVADIRAPTPSVAAELASPDRDDYLYSLRQLQQQLELRLWHQLHEKRHALLQTEKCLQQQYPGTPIKAQLQECGEWYHRLQMAWRRYIATLQQRCDDYQFQLHQFTPQQQLAEYRLSSYLLQQRLMQSQQRLWQEKQHQFENMCQLLSALNPLATLSRGYAIASSPTQTALVSSKQVNVGDTLYVRLQEGQLQCRVEKHLD